MSRLSTKTHPLLTESVIDILFTERIFTITNFIEADTKQLANITNLTYKNILTIRKHIINKNAAVRKNGLEDFREWLNKSALLQTGITNIDSILNGGLATGHIYELCGLPASGKTQFCITITRNMVETFRQHVYYLDCKGDFNAARIKIMLDTAQKDYNESARIMSQILVKRITTLFELINSLHQIKDEIHNKLNVKLIIIDSLPSLLSQFEDFSKCNTILNHLGVVMRFLASEYYVCFVVTNVITTWYEGTVGEDKLLVEKIGSGNYWQSIPNTRLKFIETDTGQYEISIIKSNDIPQNVKCLVSINDAGMV